MKDFIKDFKHKVVNLPFIDFKTAKDLYLKSIYFACTTMTTVGYGDYYAGGNHREQTFCMVMIFFGMAVFALV